jgi:hypothetical protein
MLEYALWEIFVTAAGGAIAVWITKLFGGS